jgi:hypothetical protein
MRSTTSTVSAVRAWVGASSVLSLRRPRCSQRDSRAPVELPIHQRGGETVREKVGLLCRWRFFRRCALCRRIGVRGFERIEQGWACLDREACAGPRSRRMVSDESEDTAFRANRGRGRLIVAALVSSTGTRNGSSSAQQERPLCAEGPFSGDREWPGGCGQTWPSITEVIGQMADCRYPRRREPSSEMARLCNPAPLQHSGRRGRGPCMPHRTREAVGARPAPLSALEAMPAEK